MTKGKKTLRRLLANKQISGAYIHGVTGSRTFGRHVQNAAASVPPGLLDRPSGVITSAIDAR
jgi:hypothetical protein